MSTVAVEQALNLGVEARGTALLELAENQWFDRKGPRVAPKDLANALIGFANAEGGTVVIGLGDGKVEGIASVKAKRHSEWLQAAFDFSRPTVPCRTRLVDCLNDRGSLDELLVIDIDASRQVHANAKDEAYLRVGDENRRLTFAQRQELIFDKGQSSFEGSVVSDAGMADLDSALIASYAEALGASDPERLLVNRGFASPEGNLTTAAVLLFAAQPQRWFPGASLRILRYGGTERGTGARQQLLHDRRIEGPIPHQLDQASAEMSDLVPTRKALGPSGRFEEIEFIPSGAWLEAIVNAVVHRSYSVSGDHIRVEIFDDRIEIESPGRFPGIVDVSDPLHLVRFARNPMIARVCADLAFGQELGEGIRRIFEQMRLAGLANPEYLQTAGSVRLTLNANAIDHELEARLPAGAIDLIRYIRDGIRVSTGELVEATGHSRPHVLSQLKALRDAGVIAWVGNHPKDPRAYWTLNGQRHPGR